MPLESLSPADRDAIKDVLTMAVEWGELPTATYERFLEAIGAFRARDIAASHMSSGSTPQASA
jgi:hypothetical protein